MSREFHVRMRVVHFFGLGLAVTGLLLVGCGESHTPSGDDRSYLKQVCLAYDNYCIANRKPPERVEDMEPYWEGGVYVTDSGNYVDDEAKRRVTSGEYVVVWGLSVSLGDEKDIVVAYEKRTPVTGGFVVTDGFDVMWMDPTELKERLLADSGGETPTSGADE